MNGPTTVPCRVSTASTATALLLIRFITFACCPAMAPAWEAQSDSEATKKVVFPESPYGVCTTRSVPSPASTATRTSVPHDSTSTSTFGTLRAPASLPSTVVTILESRRRRSAWDGRTISYPSSAQIRSVSSSKNSMATFGRPPREARKACTSGSRSR